MLNRMSQEISATLDLQRVMEQLLREATDIVGAEGASVWLWDEEDEEQEGWLVCRAVFQHDQDRSLLNLRLRHGQGVAGWVAQTGESISVASAPGDPRFFAGIDERTGFRTTSLLAVPLRARGAVIGVLELVNKPGGDFDTDDATLVETLAASAAIAIENARLHQELQDHAEQLEQRVRERTAEIQAQYARLEAILDSTTDGIVVTDVGGEILQTNPVAQTWLARTLSLKSAARLWEAVRDLARQAAAETAGAKAAGGERPEAMLELEGLDLELRAAPISPPPSPLRQASLGYARDRQGRLPRLRGGREEGKAAVVVAIHDVSHLKALDRIKTRFVSNVSHELRTPITTIKLYAHLMQQQPEKWGQYLDTLAQEADHQARLVEDILQISRIDAGRLEMEPRPTSLNELTEAVIVSHQTLAQEQGLTLEHYPSPAPSPPRGEGRGEGPIALVDPKRMMQVLNNLVGNAIRYTPEGGKVVVSTGIEEAEGRTWATVTVTDTGMGIPEDELPHVFDRFFRGVEPRDMQLTGTGLGLAIVQEIVELHGGWVTVESPSTGSGQAPSTVLRAGEEGVGSTFAVWLPLAD